VAAGGAFVAMSETEERSRRKSFSPRPQSFAPSSGFGRYRAVMIVERASRAVNCKSIDIARDGHDECRATRARSVSSSRTTIRGSRATAARMTSGSSAIGSGTMRVAFTSKADHLESPSEETDGSPGEVIPRP
jgi:hypothetical protein